MTSYSFLSFFIEPPTETVFGHSKPYNLEEAVVDIPDLASYWKLNDYEYTGKGTTLLVFDTGIKESHQSFASKPLFFNDPWDDKDGHGTLCSAIACGGKFVDYFNGNRVEFRGVAPGAQLAIWKAYEKASGDINVDAWVAELNKLLNECGNGLPDDCGDGLPDVIVISSGTKSHNQPMEKAINILVNKGVIVVCSAGNYSKIDNENVTFPARYPLTISVGAHKRNKGQHCDFSAVEEVVCLALGEDVIGPSLSNSLTQSSGTSFAAPAVGGLICLILEAIHETCKKENRVGDIYEQFKSSRVMKQLLRKLLHVNKSISPQKVGKFFRDPNQIIKDLQNEGTIT